MCCGVLCRRILAEIPLHCEASQLPSPLMGPDRGLSDAPQSYYLCDGDCALIYYLLLVVVGLVFQDLFKMPVHWLLCSAEKNLLGHPL